MKTVKTLVGSGDKGALFVLPFVVAVSILAIVDSSMLLEKYGMKLRASGSAP